MWPIRTNQLVKVSVWDIVYKRSQFLFVQTRTQPQSFQTNTSPDSDLDAGKVQSSEDASRNHRNSDEFYISVGGVSLLSQSWTESPPPSEVRPLLQLPVKGFHFIKLIYRWRQHDEMSTEKDKKKKDEKHDDDETKTGSVEFTDWHQLKHKQKTTDLLNIQPNVFTLYKCFNFHGLFQ